MIGRKVSARRPSAPVTMPTAARALGKGPDHIASERTRIAAAVRTPAQGMALVVATTASAAWAKPARWSAPVDDRYASLRMTRPPLRDCGLLPTARAVISEPTPNRPPRR